MAYSVLIVPVVLPVLFWAWYHYHKDRHLPEPISHLLLAFLLGGVAFALGKLMYAGLGLVNLRFDAFLLAETDRLALLLYALLAIGPIEELAKVIPFLVVVRRFPEFDEPIDGIIYASFIALGFAAIENVYYFQYLTSGEALARGFVGPVVHIVFASVWGYYVGRACLAETAAQTLPSVARISWDGESKEFLESGSSLYITFSLALALGVGEVLFRGREGATAAA